MAGSSLWFRKSVPFRFELFGSLNGEKFTIEGSGEGDSTKGYHKGKFICTSGKCPMAYGALGVTFGYGFKMFAKYPNGLRHWFQEVMPEGYTYDREIKYEGEGGGVMKTHQELFIKDGVVHNVVKLEATGFAAGHPVLTGDMGACLPNEVMQVPIENGTKEYCMMIHPRKSDNKSYIHVSIQTDVKQRGGKKVESPPYHFLKKQFVMSKDEVEKRDHVIYEEYVIAHEMDLVNGITY